MVRPTPRLADALPPLKVTYWLAGTSVGRFKPPYPMSIPGQMMVWNGMLSLPMK